MRRSFGVVIAVLALATAAALADPDGERRTPVVRAVERASPAVVNISTTQLQRRDPFFDEWFGMFQRPRAYPVKSAGSGGTKAIARRPVRSSKSAATGMSPASYSRT